MRVFKTIIFVFISLLVAGAAIAYISLSHYKQELTAAAIDHLNARFGADIKCERVNVSLAGLPRVGLRLRNVSVSSQRSAESFLRARSVSVTFNLRDLLHRRFTVHSLSLRDAEIYYTKKQDGTDTINTGMATDTSGEEFDFDVRKIHLRNVRLVYRSDGPGQHFDLVFKDSDIKIRNFSDGLEAKLKGQIFSNGLTFRNNRGSFFDSSEVQLDVALNFFFEERSLCVRPGSVAKVNGHDYKIAAVLKFAGERTIGLIAETSQVTLDQVRMFVNPRIRRTLSNYEASRPFNATAILLAPIGKKEEPALIIQANTRNNRIRVGSSRIPYTEVGFNARIVCVDSSGKKGDIENATITFSRLFGKIYEFPFAALVQVSNLRNPYLSVSAKMNIDAADIGFSLKNEFELKGRAQAHIKYAGLASRINKKEFLGNRMKLTAELQLLNLQYREKKRPYVYTLNGPATVVSTDVHFNGLRLGTVAGDAVLEGKVDGFVNFLLGHTNGFSASIRAHSDSLNLNPVLMRGHADDNQVAAIMANDTAFAARAGRQDSLKAGTVQAGKEVLSRFEFDILLSADKLVMRRVHAQDARIKLNYADETLGIKSMQLYTCGGKFTASGTIEKFSSVTADVSAEGMDVNALFTQFENFGQETIVSDNLKGRIHLQARFSSQLDDRLEVIGETMSGEVRLSLKDGQLVNFEPVKKLSNFLFRNRDFNNVTFSELNESFLVRGYEMTINELEIGSNILNLYVVNGVYNFKGTSNINLLVPWSNLKRRTRDHIPATTGQRADNAKGVKLNFYGPANKMKLSLGHKDLTVLKPSI